MPECLETRRITHLLDSAHFTIPLKEMYNSYFCITPKNHWLIFVSWKKILKSTITKKVDVYFYNLGRWRKLSKEVALIIFPTSVSNGFIWNPSKVQKLLFERIAPFLWKIWSSSFRSFVLIFLEVVLI